MLRFNEKECERWKKKIEFQYILCCGSTKSDTAVQTQTLKFQYILCCGSTNKNLVERTDFMKFQYILCCGSTGTTR